MPESYVETTNRSWFSRIQGALTGIVAGIILVIAAVGGLFWNEGRAVKTATSLSEGAGQVMTVDVAEPGSEANGKLVHFTGDLRPMGIPSDDIFKAVSAPEGAIRLVRKVEMYQWDEDKSSEKRTKLGGGEETVTTYSYSMKWSDKPIRSDGFKQKEAHINPPMPFEGKKFAANSGKVGNIELDGKDFSSLGDDTPIPVDDIMLATIKTQFGAGKYPRKDGDAILVGSHFKDIGIGDVRISYAYGDADVISVVGKLQDGRILPFETSNGRKLSMFKAGSFSAKEMFDAAISNNTMITWLVRLGGFIAMVIGFKMVFSIVGVLGDVIPFIGNVLRFATGMAAFAIAALISSLVIGFAWIYYRPVIGIAIIALGIILAMAAMFLGKKRARKNAGSNNDTGGLADTISPA